MIPPLAAEAISSNLAFAFFDTLYTDKRAIQVNISPVGDYKVVALADVAVLCKIAF